MSNVSNLISQRMRQGDSPKAAALGTRAAAGNLTSFVGLFGTGELNDKEKLFIEEILREYAFEESPVKEDLSTLLAITSEVKAINNQAALLHGERIKRAQTILTRYRDGAFTRWLIAAYGNRQTPYNFLQYYDFYEASPKPLRTQIEAMPRQAIYTLASRAVPVDEKHQFVTQYQGKNKRELLTLIRETFPLGYEDKRQANVSLTVLQDLKKLNTLITRHQKSFSSSQKTAIEQSLKTVLETLCNPSTQLKKAPMAASIMKTSSLS